MTEAFLYSIALFVAPLKANTYILSFNQSIMAGD